MDFKNKVLLGLISITIVGFVSPNNIYADKISAKSSGMYAAVFYQPTFTHSMEFYFEGDDMPVVWLLKDFKSDWIGAGLELGYNMGGSFVLGAKITANNLVKLEDGKGEMLVNDTQIVELNNYNDIYLGVLADYRFDISKSIIPFLGVGAGLDFINFNFKNPDVSNKTDQIHAIPIAVQGRIGVIYNLNSVMQPYISYTYNYIFEKKMDSSVKLIPSDESVKLIPSDEEYVATILKNAKQSLLQIGVIFNF